MANTGVILIDAAAAVGTSATEPQCEFNKWTLRVVRPQATGNEIEKVEQSSLGQCLADCMPTITFAQPLIHDMRMCYVVT